MPTPRPIPTPITTPTKSPLRELYGRRKITKPPPIATLPGGKDIGLQNLDPATLKTNPQSYLDPGEESKDTLAVKNRVLNMFKNTPTQNNNGQPLQLRDMPDIVSVPQQGLMGGATYPKDKYNNVYVTAPDDVYKYDDKTPSQREVALHEMVHRVGNIDDMSSTPGDSNYYKSYFNKDGKDRAFPSWVANRETIRRAEFPELGSIDELQANSVYDTYLELNAPAIDKEFLREKELDPSYKLPSEYLNLDAMHKQNTEYYLKENQKKANEVKDLRMKALQNAVRP
jgi:hypothetical protein